MTNEQIMAIRDLTEARRVMTLMAVEIEQRDASFKLVHDAFERGVIEIESLKKERGAAYNAGLEAAAKVCERDLCDRPDDHPANYFDGGLRHCADAIRALKVKP